MNKVRLLTSVVLALLAGVVTWIVRPGPESYWFAVLAGVIAIVVFELGLILCELIRDWTLRRPLRTVMGRDCFKEGLSLLYATFGHSKAAKDALAAKDIKYPHVATDDHAGSAAFQVNEPVAAHDLRSILYVGELVTRHGATFRVRNAAKVVDELDLSFVCFGLGGSQKARQVLKELARFGIGPDENFQLIYLASKTPVVKPVAGHDVGYIIKLTPHLYPKRTWLLCGGLGGPGTAAAGFFLARRLGEIPRLRTTIGGERIGDRPFLIGITTEPEMDQSAEAQTVLILRNESSSSG
jgi:hypothetical protein